MINLLNRKFPIQVGDRLYLVEHVVLNRFQLFYKGKAFAVVWSLDVKNKLVWLTDNESEMSSESLKQIGQAIQLYFMH